MRKTSVLRFLFLFSALVCVSLVALAGCDPSDSARPDLITCAGNVALGECVSQKILWAEWLAPYDPKKPLLVAFHGACAEGETFDIDLDAEAYSDEVVDAEEIGYEGQGLKLNADKGTYDMRGYWLERAEFNVLVIHAERFFCDTEKNCLVKTLSTYAGEYVENGERKAAGIGLPLHKAVAALYLDARRAEPKSIEETRFVGYGVGANLACACADFLLAQERMTGKFAFAPDRVTATDPYLSDSGLELSSVETFSGALTRPGVADVLLSCAKSLRRADIPVELIETAETVSKPGGATVTAKTNESYGYSSDPAYAELLDNVASLAYSESYSACASFAEYKKKKRVGFDWYIYSIIGSDDRTVGHPKEYSKVDSTRKSNWSPRRTRPILDDRRVSDDPTREAKRFDFGIGAWTSTRYLAALVGRRFSMRVSSFDPNGSDIHGNAKFDREPYVAKKFRAETHQCSDLSGLTVLTGLVCVDADEDGYLRGADPRVSTDLLISVEPTDSDPIFKDVRIASDSRGRFRILFKDAKTRDEPMLLESASGNCAVFSGYSGSREDGSVAVRVAAFVPVGLTSRDIRYRASSDGDSEKPDRASFNAKAEYVFTLTRWTVHSPQIANCFFKAKPAES